MKYSLAFIAFARLLALVPYLPQVIKTLLVLFLVANFILLYKRLKI
jgi:hypothetical protein